MTNEYTQGLLTYDENWDDRDGAAIRDSNGNAVADDGSSHGEYGQTLRGANARRLVACWNAFDRMPTNDIEQLADIGQGVLNLVVVAHDLKAERDALEQHLRAVVNGWRQGDNVVGPMHAAMEHLGIQTIIPAPEESAPAIIDCPGDLPKCKWEPMQPYGSKCATCGDIIPF